MFIIYSILNIVRYFYNAFGNEYAAAVGIGGADLFIIGIILLLLQRIIFDGTFF